MIKKQENKELEALINLLDDPDNQIYEQIREKIFSYGADAIPSLEYAWENTFNPNIQERIEYIIHKLQLESLYAELQNWKYLESHNLIKAAYLAAKYQYPDLSFDQITKQVDDIRKDIWLELNEHLTGLEKIKVLNHIFFDIHQFRGNKENIHAPQNNYINNLLETKKGNPLSLSILYSTLAQQLQIPVYGINLPNHFILAYLHEMVEGPFRYTNEREVLFYINPFNKGAIFTRKQIDQFVKQLNLKPEDSFYYPCPNEIIIKRLFNNLIFSYEKLGYPEKTDEVKKIMRSLG